MVSKYALKIETLFQSKTILKMHTDEYRYKIDQENGACEFEHKPCRFLFHA
jgi:hypothetical protein